MVRSTFATIFILLATIVSVVLTFPHQLRDIGQLEQDIEDFSADLTELDYAVSLYPPTRYGPKISDISGKFDLTKNGLQRCIDDINRIRGTRGTRLSKVEAEIILKLVQHFKPTILHTLATVRSKKGVFKKSHMVPFILRQINDLRHGVMSLIGGLMSVVPIQFQGEATVLRQEFGAAFLKTSWVYYSNRS